MGLPSPHCGFQSTERHEECPKCGIIIEKLFFKDVREGLEEELLLLKYQLEPKELAEWMGKVPHARGGEPSSPVVAAPRSSQANSG